MLLTKSEQKKIQKYIEKQMILDNELIRNLLGDPDLELLFIKHMIKKDYAQAFKLCLDIQDVWLNLNQIQIVINYIDPTINQDMSELSIFGQTDTFNFEALNNRLQIKLTQLYYTIFE